MVNLNRNAYGYRPIMKHISVQLDNAVHIAVKRLRAFKKKPNDKEIQLELFRALRRANFLCAPIHPGHKDSINKLYEAIEQASNLLDNGVKVTSALRGIRHQVKEIREAHRNIVAA